MKQLTKVAIRYNVSTSHPGRVYFTVQRYDGPTEYRTNDNRQGAWQVFPHGEDKQILGTGVFSLTGNRSTDWSRIMARLYDGDMALSNKPASAGSLSPKVEGAQQAQGE